MNEHEHKQHKRAYTSATLSHIHGPISFAQYSFRVIRWVHTIFCEMCVSYTSMRTVFFAMKSHRMKEMTKKMLRTISTLVVKIPKQDIHVLNNSRLILLRRRNRRSHELNSVQLCVYFNVRNRLIGFASYTKKYTQRVTCTSFDCCFADTHHF